MYTRVVLLSQGAAPASRVSKCLFCLLFFDLCEVYGWVSI